MSGAACVLTGCALISWISGAFVFGVGHAARPIPEFLACYGVVWLGFAAGAVAVLSGRPAPVAFVFVIGIAARVVLFPSNLVQENDVYRYVLDGQATVHGVNPFAHPPDDIERNAPEHFQESLDSPGAQRVLSRISYGHLRTIYPPAAQASFAAGAFAGGWHWLGQRAVFLTYDILALGLLLVLLQRLALPAQYIVFYAWNPLVLKEIANSVHSDSLAAVFLVLAVGCCARALQRQTVLWAVLASAALAGAVLARLYPVMLLPALAAFLWRTPGGWRAAIAGLTVFAACLGVAYLPFAGVGLPALTESLRAYGSEWVRNAGAFYLYWGLCGCIFAQPETAAFAARLLAAASVAIHALAWAVWLYRRPSLSNDTLIRAWQAALLLWLLVMPASFPWYAIGLLAISTMRPRLWTVVLPGAMGLYYANFLFTYRGYAEAWRYAALALQHGAIWLSIGFPWFRTCRIGRQRRNGS